MGTALFRVKPLLFGRIPGNAEVVAYVPINENGNLKNAKASSRVDRARALAYLQRRCRFVPPHPWPPNKKNPRKKI
jgi:hypothetical protein